MNESIKLRVKRLPKADERRCVQINGKANKALMEIYRATGLPIGVIVSQMIIQGAKLIEIVEESEEE